MPKLVLPNVESWERVKSDLRFFLLAMQARYSEALAQLSSVRVSRPRSGWQQVAAYRLGLYRTVAGSSWDGRHRHGGCAYAVSLAASGQFTAAQAVVEQMLALHGRGSHQRFLADALAPFMPSLALSMLQPSARLSPLGLALLLRNGEREAAAHGVRVALAAGRAARQPELWLLGTNALGGTPREQLNRLNAYLQAFSLPHVALRNPDEPPSARNLHTAAPLPVAHGPLVSVIMTAFNAAERIGPALQGLLAQTWRNLEVLVVDDGSTDNTPEVVQEVTAVDARVRYVRMPSNAGTYVAKTVGLALARGEFVTCHDADDWSHPLRIERQVQPLIQDSRLVATTSQWVRIQDDGVFYARPVHPLARLNPASPMFRKQVVQERTGLWDTVRTGADSEFHSRLKLVFGRRAVRRLVMPLAFGAHHAESLMNASATGYNIEGVSPTRLNYWESWTHWHIDCLRQGKPMVMPRMGEERVFAAPAEITVSKARVLECRTFAHTAVACGPKNGSGGKGDANDARG